MAGWDDIEVVTFRGSVRVDASNVTDTNTAGGDLHRWEGLEILDYDDIVDRNEELHLLQASHRATGFVNGGEDATPSTQYGVMAAVAEVSASPARSSGAQMPTGGLSSDAVNQLSGSPLGGGDDDDSIDLIGRRLMVKAGQDFSDSSTGTGGAAGEGDDDWQGSAFPAEYGRFHPRDELFLNGEFRLWNMDVAGAFLQVEAQHVYGVLED